jgi:hypothetical protein
LQTNVPNCLLLSKHFVDYEKSIACSEKALAIEHNNPIALIVLAHAYEYQLGGVDDMLLHQIKNLETGSNEMNSMLKYVASWSYADGKKDDHAVKRSFLKNRSDYEISMSGTTYILWNCIGDRSGILKLII